MLTVILAGGESRRMGRDKATLPWQGGSMLQHLIDRYAALGPVAVCVDRAGRVPFTGAQELTDPFPGQGPLNGILAGFEQTEEAELFLTATDLPFGEPALVHRLSSLRGACDACLLCGERGPEPLYGVYGRSCLSAAKSVMAEGRRAMRAVLDRLNVNYVNQKSLPDFDLNVVLRNVNTPEEYEQFLRRSKTS